MIKLIWCQDKNGGIAKNEQLAWNVRAEMQHFINHTNNQIVVMGRKTYQSIGKPLPHRTNVVLSKSPLKLPEGVYLFHDIPSLINHFKNQDLYVIGGKSIYHQFANLADELIVSYLPDDYQCDLKLDWDFSQFTQVHHEHFFEFDVKYYEKTRALSWKCDLNNFSGPIDLLLLLVKNKKYDLNNLDIQAITDQYVGFVRAQIDHLSLDRASEYLSWAAQLLHLKAQSLLAENQQLAPEALLAYEQERDRLIARLQTYKQIYHGLNYLAKKHQTRWNYFLKSTQVSLDAPWYIKPDNKYLPQHLSVDKLAAAFNDAIAKLKLKHIKKQQINIVNYQAELIEQAFMNWWKTNNYCATNWLSFFQQLPSNEKNLTYLVSLFVVLLDLAKNQKLFLSMNERTIMISALTSN